MIRRRSRGSQREPTIALINVVFLMLIFFMVSGTLAPPLDSDVTLVNTAELETSPPPDALVIGPDGTPRYRGAEVVDVAGYVATQGEVVRIVPDRALEAARLVAVSGQLRRAGAKEVLIVTEQGIR